MFAYPFAEKIEEVMVQAGDYLENRIGERIEHSSRNAPDLTGLPEEKVWYKVSLPEGIAGDGSRYHIYLKKGTKNRLCIFFSGGGVAWDDYSLARPVTGGKAVTGQPNFYWNNLRPFTQIMNINIGITETGRSWNPFDSWSFIVVTYATGDFHVGGRDCFYQTENGEKAVMHFQGHRNFREAMKVALDHFPDPKRLLIAGDSAGAFAVPALAPEIMEEYYPSCKHVTLFSDSALLLADHWLSTVRDFWGAEEAIWKPLCTDNIFLDWYKNLIGCYGDRVQYLYACSVRDYLLSAFHNAVHNNDYSTGKDMQDLFQARLFEMVAEMKKTDPKTGFFLNRFRHPVPGFAAGGTIHTAVRKPWFHMLNNEEATLARWLFDGTAGRVYDVGMELLKSDQ